MHSDHQAFISAIDDRRKVALTFVSKQDRGTSQRRTCAPMDVAPRANAKDQSDCYHFWDYDSADGPHVLSLLPEQVIEIAPTDDNFDPGEFVTWTPSWHYSRDWGAYS